MAASTYVGVAGVNRKLTQIPVGVGGVNRACKSAWAGVAGVNRQVFASGTPLSAKAIGSIIKLKENGVQTPFIVLSHGYPASGRTLLVRQFTKTTYNVVWNEIRINRYENSTVDTWLNQTYLSYIDSSIKNQISSVTIKCYRGENNLSVITISRQVFLLSYAELGSTYDDSNDDGTYITYFSSNERRTFKYDDHDGSPINIWTRTPVGQTGARYLTGSGELSTISRSVNNAARVVPAFTLPSSILLNDNSEIIA